jgi:hypothetical protein
MCKRALILNRTDYLCNKHAYYIHTSIHRKRERAREGREEEKEREREQERDEKRRKKENTNTVNINTSIASILIHTNQNTLRIDIRLDVHANAWSQYDK